MSGRKRVAILGGTGNLGAGLALRLVKAGWSVIIGSRDAARAQAKAEEIGETVADASLDGMSYRDAAWAADIVILSVPFASQLETLESARDGLQGKILIDATVPLVPPRVSVVQLPPEGSAAVRAQKFLGEDVRVVSAFQNVGAHHLHDLDHAIDCEVLVTGNDKDARETVIHLIADCGLKGHHAGQLANAAAAEALTSILIAINRATKSDRAGIKITGI